MKLDYVPAEESDIPIIASMARALIDAYEDMAQIDYERVMAWTERKIRKFIKEYTCVCMDGEKAAFFRLAEGELDDLYVLPSFRGRGIGTEMLKYCIQTSRQPLYLYVFTGNVRAVALYQRMGFAVTEQISPTRVIMRRDGHGN